MILVFGGTTEGRNAVRLLDESGSPYWYSTRSGDQSVSCRNGIRISGALDEQDMIRCCREHGIRLIIDAAHPFALRLHDTIDRVSRQERLPVIRFERRYPPRDPGIRWCEDYPDALQQLERAGIRSLLALTGVQTIARLKPFWEKHLCRFRVLDREDSVQKALSQGFPREQLIFFPLDGISAPEDPVAPAAVAATAAAGIYDHSGISEVSDVSGAVSLNTGPAEVLSGPAPAKASPSRLNGRILRMETDLLRQLAPEAVLTKESGESGYFPEKAAAARALGIPVFAIKRPPLPASFLTVTGEFGLRKKIEQLLPEFFPLHWGVTTGTCAAAAAKAATLTLLTGCESASVSLSLPSGEEITLPVARTEIRSAQPHGTETSGSRTPRTEEDRRGDPFSTEPRGGKIPGGKIPGVQTLRTEDNETEVRQTETRYAEMPGNPFIRSELPEDEVSGSNPVCSEPGSGSPPSSAPQVQALLSQAPQSAALRPESVSCTVIKDAGDDPDVTDGSAVTATVRFNNTPHIRILRGEGVGVVTLPGLGIPVGEPAVNAVPREMIRREIRTLTENGADITLSIAGGRELAEKTFNPKLGIEGGLSIIGTSGIVRPFSSEAFIAAIQKEIDVAKALGNHTLVINSGARSERFVRREYPHLPPQAFIHYGNYIGETLSAAARRGIKKVILGIMLGKAVKLACGELDTHSRKTVMNKAFLRSVAQQAGCSSHTEAVISGLTLARELWTLLPVSEQDKFFPELLGCCYRHTAPLLPGGTLDILLISEDGEIPYRKKGIV